MERFVLQVKELVVRSGVFSRGGKTYLSSTVGINREDTEVEEARKEEIRHAPYSRELASAWMVHPVTGDYVPDSHFSDFRVRNNTAMSYHCSCLFQRPFLLKPFKFLDPNFWMLRFCGAKFKRSIPFRPVVRCCLQLMKLQKASSQQVNSEY